MNLNILRLMKNVFEKRTIKNWLYSELPEKRATAFMLL